MFPDYIPVLFMLMVATAIALGAIVLSYIFSPRKRTYVKQNVPYESGVDPVGSARFRFDVKFYLIALLFVIFDLEVVYFYPWAVVFRDMVKQNLTILYAMLVFAGLLIVGLVYEWKKGALDWK